MNRRLLGIYLVGTILMYAIACYAQSDEAQESCLFYKAVSPELTREINEHLEKFAESQPLSAEKAHEVRELVRKINIKCSDLNDPLWPRIREIGPPSIPIIAKGLLSQDSQSRRKALMALGTMSKAREYITAEYEPTEKLLILLCRRSLLDKDVEIRLKAVAMLAGMGFQRIPKVPESIQTALVETMASDPELRVRQLADHRLQDLGLIPRDPNREETVN